MIWCNHKYKFRGKSLQFSHWARDGILKPSQLYDDQGNLDTRGIFGKLTHKAGYIFEYQTLRSVFPQRNALPIIHGQNDIENDEKQDILNYVIRIPGGETKLLGCLTSKDIYNIFLFSNPPTMLPRTYWAVHKFAGVDFDWEKWGEMNFVNEILPRKIRDFHFKLFHGVLNCESRLKKMKDKNGMPYSNGLCKNCSQQQVENSEHVLIDCSYRSKIWKVLQMAIEDFIGHPFYIDRLKVMTGHFNGHEDQFSCLILNCLLGLTRYHLWLTRNSIKYDSILIPFETCYLKLKHVITNHIALLLSSKFTKIGIKTLLPRLKTSIESIFVRGLREENL